MATDTMDVTSACAESSVSMDLAPGDSGLICPIFRVPEGTTITEVQYGASGGFMAFGDTGNDAIWRTG
jgi:hypothetical protein